jgi:DNA modification methylase
MTVDIRIGDCRQLLAAMPDESVHCVVTSPPYFGLRDYGVAGQIGLEPTPDAFVAEMVAVFRDVRRVLRDDGTLWLNLGDSYASSSKGSGGPDSSSTIVGTPAGGNGQRFDPRRVACGVPDKNLLGIPWRVAFALQADGWYLRQDIIWSKPNPMPESVTDRCTKAHEYLFLLSKSARYWYDADAVAEAAVFPGDNRAERTDTRKDVDPMCMDGGSRSRTGNPTGDTRNRRSVWTVATQPFSEAHFATFPPDLIEPCIKAGCPKQCCAKCGAPVTNATKTSYAPTTRTPPPNKGHIGAFGERAANMTRDGFIPNREKIIEDLGQVAGCACDAGTMPGTVLDPFGGAGTTGLVADRLGRNAILLELNPTYAEMARRRIANDAGMFAEVAAQ